tara:strand:+ start:756 stop:1067 length:312 start_codon:yes stop_codon:yes gene_type:complete
MTDFNDWYTDNSIRSQSPYKLREAFEAGAASQSVASQVETLRDKFVMQALANPEICTGVAKEYDLQSWFGVRGGITRYEIIAMQASECADAMLEARKVKGEET